MGAALLGAGTLVGAYLLDPVRGDARRAGIAESARRLAGRARAQIARAFPFLHLDEDAGHPADWPDEAPPDVDSES